MAVAFGLASRTLPSMPPTPHERAPALLWGNVPSPVYRL